MPRRNTIAIVLGAVSTTLVALWLLTERDPPAWPALVLALAGVVLIARTYRREGWSRSSALALVLCGLPWVLVILGRYV